MNRFTEPARNPGFGSVVQFSQNSELVVNRFARLVTLTMADHVSDLEQDVPDGAYVSFPMFMFG